MKKLFHNFYYSFPIQLLLLHFRKSQVLLILWLILFLTVSGHFMGSFGANTLFLAPEYLGNVNAAGAAITGVATGIFIMSWNITTFILHSGRFRFLATSSKPFLKYCLNNAIIPIAFLILYFLEALYFDRVKELIPLKQFLFIVAGFAGGFSLLLLISFLYFFGADRTIIRTLPPVLKDIDENKIQETQEEKILIDDFGLPVKNYLSTRLKVKKVRSVKHYSQNFLDVIFKRHHFSAMLSILFAFIFMLFIAFFLDNKFFQIPASASILLFFSILISVMGALTYFLRSWSLLFIILLYTVLNILYKYDVIDPRNKAYGLNYTITERPVYSLESLESLNTEAKIDSDKNNMISILNHWKQNQHEDKPLMIVFNFSGGGVRSASFSMNVLQELDSITGGRIMNKTMLISGASGGMLAAAYFRELARLKINGARIDLENKKYLDNISKDLLNPVFSSLVTRDLISPSQKFSYNHYSYVKDRGYAFEEKLDLNTQDVLDKPIGFYEKDEKSARIPLMILNSTVTRDFKKMMICTQPISFMMQPSYKDSTTKITGPDAIDFAALFKNKDPMDLRMLTALRMNATYPYVLPAVWLPSKPIIDVMDAGLRDNSGAETSYRFLNVFKDWIKENTRGILLIQVRSRIKGSWSNGYKSGGISDIITNPFTMIQTNWFTLQDYFQEDELAYLKNTFGNQLHRVSFMYIPKKPEGEAPLNFHLTASEKNEVSASMHRENNIEAIRQVESFLKTDSTEHQ
ncbi:MAG: patatin-like phospholipase family protein [Bacteroidota bacterium]|nr:patatin-like phospholipase family protein [Bacteroidota bacterium]